MCTEVQTLPPATFTRISNKEKAENFMQTLTLHIAHCICLKIQSAAAISRVSLKLKTHQPSECCDPLKEKHFSPKETTASSVKAGSCAAVVHADLVGPTGDAGLGVQGGGDGLNAAVLTAARSVQAGRRVTEVGGGPVVRAQARLRSLLGVLSSGPVQVLSHSGCLAGAVVPSLALLLRMLLALLLVGLFHVTVVRAAKQEEAVVTAGTGALRHF